MKKKKSGFIKIPGRGPRPILSERALGVMVVVMEEHSHTRWIDFTQTLRRPFRVAVKDPGCSKRGRGVITRDLLACGSGSGTTTRSEQKISLPCSGACYPILQL